MDVYARLGVRPIVNARGMNTMASGSLMPKPVLDAMTEAAGSFVDMGELNARAGAHIARLVGVEGAHVTSGSAGGLLLAAAACIAGDDASADRPPARHHRDAERDRDPAVRPDPVRPGAPHGRRGPGRGRQRGRLHAGGARGCHRPPDRRAHLHRLAGARRARGRARAHGPIAHARGLPLIVDAASTLPPVGHLRRWTDTGADLVILSGGKGIRGPQNTGLLVGRADLIRAAAANGAPNAAIGRPCKVSKEAIIGLVTAIELFLQEDHDAEWARHLDEARRILAAAAAIAGVRGAPRGGPHRVDLADPAHRRSTPRSPGSRPTGS